MTRIKYLLLKSFLGTLFSAAFLGSAMALPSGATSGTLSEAEPSLIFEGLIPAGANVASTQGAYPCQTGLVECDSYPLTVNLSEQWRAENPDETIAFELTHSNGDCFELYVYDLDNNQVAGQDITECADVLSIEFALSELPNGNYLVDVVPFLVDPAVYTVKADLSGFELDYSVVAPASDSERPQVVVAVLDSNINPYHDFYYAGSPIYPNGRPSSVTTEVLDALGVKEENRVTLTRGGTFAENVAADQAFWSRVVKDERYHFVGTNIVAVSHAGDGVPVLVPTAEKSAHGVGTSAAVLDANPDAIIFFVETEGAIASQVSEAEAFDEPLVDVISTSYGAAVPSTGFQLPEEGSMHRSYEGVVLGGKLHFSSAGNNIGLSNTRSGAGPWWSIGVSGIEENSSEGETFFSGNLPDFVSDFTQKLPYCTDCTSEYDGSVRGTSFSTPRAAGLASKVILEARRRLGHVGGIVEGAELPVLAKGRGVEVSNWFVRRALEESAWVPTLDDFDAQAAADDLAEPYRRGVIPLYPGIALPINPAAPWLQLAWGDLTTHADKGVVAAALAHLGLGPAADLRSKEQGFCDFQTQILLQRKLYFDQIVSNVPFSVLGNDRTGRTPDNDPFLFCASRAPNAPASNDPGGNGWDSAGDMDGDAVPNDTDNCPFEPNPGQSDADGDGKGDACDDDFIDTNTVPVADDIDIVVEFETPLAVTLVGRDEDEGDVLSYLIVSQPTHGTVGVPNGNQVVYTPDDDFKGSDSFTYKVNDGKDDSNTATVRITVNSENNGGGGDLVELIAEIVCTVDGTDSFTYHCDASGSHYWDGQTETPLNAPRFDFYAGDNEGQEQLDLGVAQASFTYSQAGPYQPLVVVRDGARSDSASTSIDVELTVTVTDDPVNAARLRIAEGFSAAGAAPHTVRFDAGASTTAPGYSISNYAWYFEGQGEGVQPNLSGPNLAVVDYTYTRAGTYKPTVVITFSNGTPSEEQVSIAKSTVSASKQPSTPAAPQQTAGGGLGGSLLIGLLAAAAIRRRVLH